MAVRTVLALAAGGGGLERAIHGAIPESRVVCYVEHEATAAGVLASEMARGRLDDAPIWSDVHTFDPEPWRGLVDIVAAGYPCQPFSVAGKQLGNADPRHLWPSIARIVRALEPRLCIFENVANHLRLGGHEVVRELQSMGYRTAATLWRAEEVGAPHRRERLFILAALPDALGLDVRDEPRGSGGQGGAGAPLAGDAGEAVGDADEGRRGRRADAAERGAEARWRGPQPAGGRRPVGDADEQGPQGREQPIGGGGYELPAWPPGPTSSDWDRVLAVRPDLAPATIAPVRGVADGLAAGLSRSDQLRILGNGVVPAQAEAALRELLDELD